MGRLRTCGHEWNTPLDGSDGPDGDYDAGGGGFVTGGSQRSGTYAYRVSEITHWYSCKWSDAPAAVQRDYFGRMYVKWDALPGSTVRALNMGNGGATIGSLVKITAAGKLQLFSANASSSQIGSDSAATIATGTWYRVEQRIRLDSSRVVTEVELLLDGVQVAVGTGLSGGTLSGTSFLQCEYFDDPGTNIWMYCDDIAVNDDQGSDQNSWPGAGSVVLSVPTADVQRGSWTGGSGGTTNLWEAINNKPIAGTASESNTTQVENTDTSGDNSTDEYQITMQSYTAAGVGAGDNIKVILAHVVHGEDSATGTKTGKYQFLSNPADGAAYTTFTFGGDAGALGTYPSNWRFSSRVLYNPSVTKGTAPVIALRKTDTVNQIGSVCAVGIYIEFAPGDVNLSAVAFAATAALDVPVPKVEKESVVFASDAAQVAPTPKVSPGESTFAATAAFVAPAPRNEFPAVVFSGTAEWPAPTIETIVQTLVDSIVFQAVASMDSPTPTNALSSEMWSASAFFNAPTPSVAIPTVVAAGTAAFPASIPEVAVPITATMAATAEFTLPIPTNLLDSVVFSALAEFIPPTFSAESLLQVFAEVFAASAQFIAPALTNQFGSVTFTGLAEWPTPGILAATTLDSVAFSATADLTDPTFAALSELLSVAFDANAQYQAPLIVVSAPSAIMEAHAVMGAPDAQVVISSALASAVAEFLASTVEIHQDATVLAVPFTAVAVWRTVVIDTVPYVYPVLEFAVTMRPGMTVSKLNPSVEGQSSLRPALESARRGM